MRYKITGKWLKSGETFEYVQSLKEPEKYAVDTIHSRPYMGRYRVTSLDKAEPVKRRTKMDRNRDFERNHRYGPGSSQKICRNCANSRFDFGNGYVFCKAKDFFGCTLRLVQTDYVCSLWEEIPEELASVIRESLE